MANNRPNKTLSQPTTPIVPSKDSSKSKVAVSFAAYQEDYVSPRISKNKNKDIQYWGSDNMYGKFIRTLYDNSSTHASIIDGKLDYIAGRDLVNKGGKNRQLDEFMLKVNHQGDSLYDIFRKCVLDDLIYGGFALQLMYTKGGKLYEMCYVDPACIRYNEVGDKLKVTPKAEDWYKGTMGNNINVLEYPLFDYNVNKGQQIFFYTGISTKDIYPREVYRPAITHIQADIEVANYNLNVIRNNITPSLIISFTNGVPSIEEQETIERNLKAKFGRTSNSAGAFLLFSEPGEEAAKITIVSDSQSSQKFLNLAKSSEDKIYAAHRANPSLFGIQQEGKLGDNQQMKISYQIFKSTVIEPKQREILAAFNKLLAPSFRNCKLSVIQLPPLNIVFQQERLLAMCQTIPELRKNLEEWGWIENAALKDGDVLVGDKNNPNLNTLDLANAAKAQAGADALSTPDDEDENSDNENEDNQDNGNNSDNEENQ